MRILAVLALLPVISAAALRPHPRLRFTPEQWAEMQTIAANSRHPDHDSWEALRKAADEFAECKLLDLRIKACRRGTTTLCTIEQFDGTWSTRTQFYIGFIPGEWSVLAWAGSGGGNTVIKLNGTTVEVRTPGGEPLDTSALSSDLTGVNVPIFARNYAPRGYISNDYQGFGYEAPLTTLALAYRVTDGAERERYGAKAMEILEYLAALGDYQMVAPIGLDSGYPARSLGVAIGLGFDWMYDHPLMTPSLKDRVVHTVNLWFDWLYSRFRKSNLLVNFTAGYLVALGHMGYGTYGENARAQDIIDTAAELWKEKGTRAFSSEGEPGAWAGGGHLEGHQYSQLSNYNIALYTLIRDVADTVTDPPAEEVARRFSRYIIHNLKPNGWRVLMEGVTSNCSGVQVASVGYKLIALLDHILDGKAFGPETHFLATNIAAPPVCAGVFEAQDVFQWKRSNRPSADYRETEPRYYSSAGDGHIFRRSSWNPDAIWSSFLAVPRKVQTDHLMRNMAHIDIQRGDDYLITSMNFWRGTNARYPGVTGSPYISSTASQYLSALFWYDNGDYNLTSAAYVGGQGVWGRWRDPLLSQNDDYLYAQNDFTEAYDRPPGSRGDESRRTLRYYFRTLVTMDSGTFVVFDQVGAKDPGYTKTIRWHLNGTAVNSIEDRSGKSTVGQSTVYVTPILPVTAEIAICNVLTAMTATTGCQDSGVKVGERFDLYDTAMYREVEYLTVLDAGPENHPKAQVWEITTIDAHHAGVVINTATPNVVVLSKGTIGSESYPGFSPKRTAQTSFTVSLQRQGKFVIGGLEPGIYEVQRNGARLTTLSVTKSGAAYFLGGDGSYVVKRVDSASPDAAIHSVQ